MADSDLEQHLARICGVSTQTVRDAISRGLELGFIERTADGRYAPVIPPGQS